MSSSVVASGSVFIIFWSGHSCFGAIYDSAGGVLVPVRGLVLGGMEAAGAEFGEAEAAGTEPGGTEHRGPEHRGPESGDPEHRGAEYHATGRDSLITGQGVGLAEGPDGPGVLLGNVGNGGQVGNGGNVGNYRAEYQADLAGPLPSPEASGVPLEVARELDTIVVVVDPSLMAVPLTLPFSGKKQVSALINAEFSDLVPFDADLYHKEFRTISGTSSKLSEVSLMAMPKELYEELNIWLDANGIKPKVVTPACSLFTEVPQFNSATNDGTTLVIGQINITATTQPRGVGASEEPIAAGVKQVALGLIANGQLVAERIVPLDSDEAAVAPWIAQFLIQGSHLSQPEHSQTEHSQTEPDELKLLMITPSEALSRQVTPELWQRVKIALRSSARATRRGDVDGGARDAGDTALEAAGRNISELTIGDMVGGDAAVNNSAVINSAVINTAVVDTNVAAIRVWAHLAAAQLSKSAKFKVAPNFRRAQLSKHPRMSDINRGIIRSLPFVGGLLVVLLLTALIAFQIRERQLELLKYTLRLRIQEFVPNFDSPEGEEVKTLQKQNRLLDTQLKDLGTTSALNPLQAFSIISRELPAGSNITIKSINLRSNSILLSGAAPDYSAVEKIERMLKRRKDIFCRIKKDTPGSAGQADKRAFSFDISLCDNGG